MPMLHSSVATQTARSTRSRHSARRPAPISVRRVLPAGRGSRSGGRVRRDATSAAATRYVPASAANGMNAPAASNSGTNGPASSPPANCWPVISRAFAPPRASRSTREGNRAVEALSKSVWSAVREKASAISRGMEAHPRPTARAKPATSRPRTVSTSHIARRWSTRSATAPPNSPNSSQGR